MRQRDSALDKLHTTSTSLCIQLTHKGGDLAYSSLTSNQYSPSVPVHLIERDERVSCDCIS